eukprot:1879216-Rhodomonas_salina.1
MSEVVPSERVKLHRRRICLTLGGPKKEPYVPCLTFDYSYCTGHNGFFDLKLAEEKPVQEITKAGGGGGAGTQEWSVEDVGNFLEGMRKDFGAKVEKYQANFKEEDVDGKALAEMTNEDFKELGTCYAVCDMTRGPRSGYLLRGVRSTDKRFSASGTRWLRSADIWKILLKALADLKAGGGGGGGGKKGEEGERKPFMVPEVIERNGQMLGE